jgi:hypothetical protein
MKLSAEEVNYVFNYIKNIDIKFYELQVELTDHLVLIMEEIWTEDPELTFHQVMFRAEQRFGKNYFKEVEEERTKLLRKEYRRLQFKGVGNYFKFPRIISTLLLIFIVYRISFNFEDISLYIKILYSVLIFASAGLILNWFVNRKINGHKFLALETAFILNNSAISISYLTLLNANNFKDSFNQNHLFLLPLCCLWVFGLLITIEGNFITKQIISDIKKQYQLI